MLTTIRLALLAMAFALSAFSQCGTTVLNPITNRLDCLGTPGSPNFKYVVSTNSTTFTVTKSQHKNEHSALGVTCFDSATPAVPLVFVRSGPTAGQFTYSVNTSTFDVNITFASGGNSGGYCSISGAGQGLAGATGPAGSTGAAGSAATVAVGTVTTGAAGSSAAVTNAGTSSAAVLNITIPQGQAGAAGVAGSQWRVSTGTPSSGTGVDGDYYLNSSTGDVYGPKASGAWPGSPTANIKGTNGASGVGSKWLSSIGVPSNSAGVDGDFYLNASTGDYWGPKVSGAWTSSVGNLKGPAGTTGAAGVNGKDSASCPVTFAGETSKTITVAACGIGTPTKLTCVSNTGVPTTPGGTLTSDPIVIDPGVPFTGTCYAVGSSSVIPGKDAASCSVTFAGETSQTISVSACGVGIPTRLACVSSTGEPTTPGGNLLSDPIVIDPGAAFTGTCYAIGATAPTGSSGTGADASGYYVTTRSTNAPSNAFNLGTLTTGVLKITVSSGVATHAVSTFSDIVAMFGSGSCVGFLKNDGTCSTVAGGDASTNTSSSVDSEVVLFSGTGGKTVKRATGTGFAKLTSGVLSTASIAASDVPAALSSTTSVNGTNIPSAATLVSTNATNTFGSSAVNDARAAAHTLPAKTGIASAKPSTCTPGEEYFATDATAGQNKYYCTALDTWTQQSGGTGTGDASTNTSSSVDSEVVLFSGTAGKTLKRATGTGFAKLTSGVLSASSIAASDVPTSLSSTTSVNGTPIPASAAALATTTTSQTIQNKTLDNTNTVTLKTSLWTLQDPTDTTKLFKWDASGITTGTTRTIVVPNANGTLLFNSRTLTCGTYLTGCGDLSADRTLDVNTTATNALYVAKTGANTLTGTYDLGGSTDGVIVPKIASFAPVIAGKFGYDSTTDTFKGSWNTTTRIFATRDATEALTNKDVSSSTNTFPAKMTKRMCEVHIWGSGASQALQDADDEAASCYNDFGVTETIAAVRCYANAGSPTVTPIVTGGGSTSILSSALTCGTASWASGTLNGTPTLSSGSTIDANVTTAGGTATNIRIVVTLTR
jgi:hypothetical protein